MTWGQQGGVRYSLPRDFCLSHIMVRQFLLILNGDLHERSLLEAWGWDFLAGLLGLLGLFLVGAVEGGVGVEPEG
jgi:hypothetical protein